MAEHYQELTNDRIECLLVVERHGGRMNHDDQPLAPFCDDKSTLTKPDIFNQCHDAGWLISRHDGFLDTSFVELTPAGRAALLATARGRAAMADIVDRLRDHREPLDSELALLAADEIEGLRRSVAAERKIAEGWQDLYDKIVRRVQSAAAALSGNREGERE